MKNLTFWEHPSYCISGKNNIQPFRLGLDKAFFALFLCISLGTLNLFTGCGPVPEETAHQKALKDSSAADSIMRLEASKIKKYESAKKKFSDSVKLTLKAQQQRKLDSLSDSTQLVKSHIAIDTTKIRKHKSPDSIQKKPKKKVDSLHKILKVRKDTLR